MTGIFGTNILVGGIVQDNVADDMDVTTVCRACGTTGSDVYSDQHFATAKTTELRNEGSRVEQFAHVAENARTTNFLLTAPKSGTLRMMSIVEMAYCIGLPIMYAFNNVFANHNHQQQRTALGNAFCTGSIRHIFRKLAIAFTETE